MVYLAVGLFLFGKNSLGVAYIQINRSMLYSLNSAAYYVVCLFRILAIKLAAFCLSEALGYYLFRGHGAYTAKILGSYLNVYNIAKLVLGIYPSGVIERNLLLLILYFLTYGLLSVNLYAALFTVNINLYILGGIEVLSVSLKGFDVQSRIAKHIAWPIIRF